MTMTIERPAETLALAEEAPPDAIKKYLNPRRWTRAEYHSLGEAGFFGNERVELLDGEVWTLPPQGTPHFSTIRCCTQLLEERFNTGFEFRQQAPITLNDGSEPEPDVAVVSGSWRDYLIHHPGPSEVRLLVEVSDATLAKDRGEKAQTYAGAGITDYWILNLIQRQLEIHREPALRPDGPLYKLRRILTLGETIAPLFAPEVVIAVADLFPPIQSSLSEPPG